MPAPVAAQPTDPTADGVEEPLNRCTTIDVQP
ncbi:hypothetical protein ABENE_05605 [Asticcacaulis benevestitus DSM 16100 = ATCC BAA-896]|uniref:Uncharacterized protein n=1 Tax=Asticcacaulis benevestitus DSM 16100 = ATCC BAA-896 TaxID=1121022 RepID=V4PYA7_9CAUL|nr:hypothetical protein ABENE_05605 [Asticcacaulis benevestitus DSM 16100 = ATCC BAA-896]